MKQQTMNGLNMKRLTQILEEEAWKAAYEEEIQKLEKMYYRISELTYNLYVKSEQSEELVRLEGELHSGLSDEKLVKVLKEWQEKIEDSTWKRRLFVFIHKIEEELIDNDPRITEVRNSLQVTLMQREFKVDDRSFSVATINSSRLEMQDRELRRRLHLEVGKYGNEISNQFRKLLYIRNEVAKEHGYKNYYECKLAFRGLNFEQYKNECFNIIENGKSAWELWESRVKERFNWNGVYSSDWLFVAGNYSRVNHEQFKPTLIKKALEGTTKKYGLDLDSLPIEVKVETLPFGGACLKIKPDDIRVVINKRSGPTVFFTAFHEYGHALYEAFSSNQCFELDFFKNIIGHEAMAEIFATITSQESWMKEFWGLAEEEIKELTESQHLFEFVLMKTYFYYSLVEQAIYEDPNCDFDEVANKYYQQVFGSEDVGFHPATELMYIMNPAYVQDYIYADGIRDMLLHSLNVEGMYLENKAFEVLKREFMEPSELYTWKEKVKNICGEDFTFAYYGEYLTTGMKKK